MAGFFSNISNVFNSSEQPDQNDRFTLTELRRLHEVLTENTIVNGRQIAQEHLCYQANNPAVLMKILSYSYTSSASKAGS
jgi:hypothetical protein